MKPPAWRLLRSSYPHFFEIQTRYRDEDRLAHVNNIAVAAYYDEARSRFSRQIFAEAGGMEDVFSETGGPSRPRIVTADSRVSYLGEVFYPDPVEIGTGITRIGGASYELGQALFQRGRCVGVCTTTFVQADKSGSSPLGAALRQVLGRFLIEEGRVFA